MRNHFTWLYFLVFAFSNSTSPSACVRCVNRHVPTSELCLFKPSAPLCVYCSLHGDRMEYANLFPGFVSAQWWSSSPGGALNLGKLLVQQVLQWQIRPLMCHWEGIMNSSDVFLLTARSVGFFPLTELSKHKYHNCMCRWQTEWTSPVEADWSGTACTTFIDREQETHCS